ncbi:MAG: excinuclease ABC subunit A, partial [Dehalococcoidia bacterium]|nr:excinuclease ABC subunit A [Dehalococcoidia bacterium]
ALLEVLQRLVDGGNTVIVIEHNLDVVKGADWVIDLGPYGGERGGLIVAYGTPEEVARNESSVTGRFLQEVLDKHAPVAPPPAKPKRAAKPSNGATPEASPKQVKAAKAAARQTRAAAGRK